ncbi:MAG: hypothetical protein WCP79_06785 [Bacillota bacterium]
MTRDKAAELAATICAGVYSNPTYKYSASTFKRFYQTLINDILEVANQVPETEQTVIDPPKTQKSRRKQISSGVTL